MGGQVEHMLDPQIAQAFRQVSCCHKVPVLSSPPMEMAPMKPICFNFTWGILMSSTNLCTFIQQWMNSVQLAGIFADLVEQ